MPELSSASKGRPALMAGEAETKPCLRPVPAMPPSPPTSPGNIPRVLCAVAWTAGFQKPPMSWPSLRALPSSTRLGSLHGLGLALIHLCVPSAWHLANTQSKFVGE